LFASFAFSAVAHLLLIHCAFAVRDLSALHTKRLMVTFDSDESAQEREIDMLTQEITDTFRHAEANLKQIQRQDDRNATPQDLAVRSNMQKSMARKLQALSMNFRQSQKEYLARVRAQKTGDEAFDFLNEETKKAISDAPDRVCGCGLLEFTFSNPVVDARISCALFADISGIHCPAADDS
jgi:syntaxin 16